MRVKIIIAIFILLGSIVAGGRYLASREPAVPPKAYGATFSSFYAEEFGLNWQDAYRALFEDLGIKKIRIPVYWEEVEPAPGAFDFSRIDWQLQTATEYGGEVIVTVGRKLPRWPECHQPLWAGNPGGAEFNKNLRGYIKTTIERYRSNAIVKIWQVENEPYLPFGDCKNYSTNMLDDEIALVRALDPTRPIMVTDSGELSLWIQAAKRADVFGSTMYRSVHNKIFGSITYPLPPLFFRLKRAFAEFFVGKKPMMIVELQGEPWSREATYKLDIEDRYQTMNPTAFRDILAYASQTSFDTFYFWGVEWWYWLKEKQNQPEMWNIAKEAVRGKR